MQRTRRLFFLVPSLLAVSAAGSDNPPGTGETPCEAGISADPSFDAAAAEELEGEVNLFAHEMGGGAVRILVATIPDPVEGFAGKDFDVLIEAVRAAMVGAGYLLVKKSLAWPTPETRRLAAEGPERQAEARLRYSSVPGALFFRRRTQDGGHQQCVVLLVGETRASGIHRRAMHTALWIAARHIPQRELTIVGPGYSGSRDSLLQALGAWTGDHSSAHPCRLTFRVVSGTASDPGNEEVLRKYHYRSYAVDTDQLAREMLEHLARLGIDSSEIALLRESTVYGAGSSSQAAAPRGPLNLSYPVHIAGIRASYQRLRAEGASRQEGVEPPELLPIELTEAAEGSDAIPQYGAGTVTMQDMVLRRTLESLRRSKRKAVGIISSNIEDTLFLAGEVHRVAPEVLLFTFEGWNLLAHPSSAEACRGMMVASSNSLFWRAEQPDSLLHFASDSQHGLFLAVKGVIENKPPPENRDKAVWLTIVGRGGLYPVLSPSDASGEACRGLSCAETWEPGSGEVLLGASFLVLLAGLGVWFRDPRHGVPWMPDFAGAALAGVITALLAGPLLANWLGAKWGAASIAVAAPIAWLARRRRSPWLQPLLLGLVVAGLVLTLFFGEFRRLGAPMQIERVYAVLSGVSPLVPVVLLLANVVLWLAAWARGPESGRAGSRARVEWYVLALALIFAGCSLLFNNGSFDWLRGVENLRYSLLSSMLFVTSAILAMDAGCRAYHCAAAPTDWREPKSVWLALTLVSLTFIYLALHSYPYEPLRLYRPVLGVLLFGAMVVSTLLLREHGAEGRRPAISIGRRPLLYVLNGGLGVMLASCFSTRLTGLMVSGIEFVAKLVG